MSDWSRGEVLPVTLYLAFMAGTPSDAVLREEVKELWEDWEILRFLQTHKYGSSLSARERDRIYRRAKNYRWMGDTLFKQLERVVMVVVSRAAERMQLAVDTHRSMGHFGLQRVLDRLKNNY